MGIEKALRRFGTTIGLSALAALTLLALQASPAAAAFGEYARFGSSGSGPGQFPMPPRLLAIDLETRVAYIGELSDPGAGLLTITRVNSAPAAEDRSTLSYDASAGSRVPLDFAVDGY
ncbi:MAG TPA: hypothetical protein VFX85_09480, partial [Solirubrobacterales bacterium]|nr:hypothetical protein [Solirubrobacterales bacterium]